MEVTYFNHQNEDGSNFATVMCLNFIDEKGASECEKCNECYWMVPGTAQED